MVIVSGTIPATRPAARRLRLVRRTRGVAPVAGREEPRPLPDDVVPREADVRGAGARPEEEVARAVGRPDDAPEP
ncbi:hypothetical protein [Luteimicrobium album]|uniref:hypothetical protein n=1 Tax=Luteimicrobium album TaxID=1054550 RepID=UPI0024E1350B|nr:hypothetical protein [Luteimicrobium album]